MSVTNVRPPMRHTAAMGRSCGLGLPNCASNRLQVSHLPGDGNVGKLAQQGTGLQGFRGAHPGIYFATLMAQQASVYRAIIICSIRLARPRRSFSTSMRKVVSSRNRGIKQLVELSDVRRFRHAGVQRKPLIHSVAQDDFRVSRIRERPGEHSSSLADAGPYLANDFGERHCCKKS